VSVGPRGGLKRRIQKRLKREMTRGGPEESGERAKTSKSGGEGKNSKLCKTKKKSNICDETKLCWGTGKEFFAWGEERTTRWDGKVGWQDFGVSRDAWEGKSAGLRREEIKQKRQEGGEKAKEENDLITARKSPRENRR